VADGDISSNGFRRFRLVTEGHEYEGQSGIPGCPFVCAAIAHEKGPAGLPACRSDGLEHMIGVGLAVGGAVGAEDDIEQVGEAKGLDQLLAEVLTLVGAHGEGRAGFAKRIQRVGGAFEGPRVDRDIGDIMRDETLERRVHFGGRKGGVLCLQAGFDHRAGAVPDHLGDFGKRHRGEAQAGQHMVQRAEQVRRRIDQRAVQIEQDCPAFKAAGLRLIHTAFALAKLRGFV